MKKLMLALAISAVSITGVCFTATSCELLESLGIFSGSTVEYKLAISASKLALNVNGKDGVLRATVTPASSEARYEWSVADPTIAKITGRTNNCTVTPLKEGTTTVTVKALDQTATCTVTVGPDLHVKLTAPSFTYDETTEVITITDTNEAERVAGYRLDFFDADGKVVGEQKLVSGDVVKTHKLDKGTYTAKLVVLGSDELYLTSDYSESEITLEVTKDKMVELGKSDSGAMESPNGWAYYSYDWVIVNEAYYYDNAATLVFSNNTADSTEYSWILQLIYHNKEIETGKTYEMTLNVNSSAEGRISLAGKAVTLKQGDNVINVGFTANEDNKGLFKIQFGVWGEYNTLKEGTVSVSIVEEMKEVSGVKMLQVPDSFTYNEGDKTVTIVDTKNNPYDAKYMLGFFADENSSTVLGSAIVENGGVLNPDFVLTGNYFVRIMAATTGAPYESSVWSSYGQTISIVNERVDIVNGGQAVAFNTPNTWFEWHATSAQSQPAQVEVEEAYLDLEGKVHVKFEAISGSSNQPMKLFYRDSAIAVGDIYKLTMKFESAMDGYITVNGTIVAVKKGSNDISVIRMQPNGNAADRNTITIQFGATVGDVEYMMQGEYVIGDVLLEKVDAVALQAPNFVYDAVTNQAIVNDSANPAEAVKEYQIGLFVEGAETPVAKFAVESGVSFDFSSVSNGTYTIKMKAVAKSNTMYVDSEWMDSEYTVTVKNRYTEIISGGQSTAYGNPGVWYYYKPGTTTVTTAVVDNEENKINVEFSCTAVTNEPLKLFYNAPDLEVGEEYTLAFKLESPMAGYITVNGKDFEIVQGSNQILVTRAQPSSTAGDRNTVTIRFGTKIGDTTYTMTGAFVISELVYGSLEQEELTAPDFTFDAAALKVTIPATEADAAKVASYQLGLFAADATAPIATFEVVSGDTIDVTEVPNGTYTVCLQAISGDVGYASSAWKNVEATLVVRNGQLDLRNGGQSVADENPNYWYEWHSLAEWNMPQTTIKTAYYDYIEEALYLEYSNDGNTNQPVKLFYQDKSIAVGSVYKLSFKLVSPMAGYMIVNDKTVAIVEGANEIEVVRALPANGTINVISIQFGATVDGTIYTMKGAFVLSEIDYAEVTLTDLTAPAFTFNTETLTVSIPATEADAAKVGSYKLGLFAEGADAPAATFTVANGDVIDVSKVENGDYIVKLQAISGDTYYADSAWTDSATKITVGNAKTDITKTGQKNAYNDPGTWYHYKEKINLEYLYIDNTTGSIYVKYEATDAGVTTPTYQPLKLFWNSPDLAVGEEYTLTFKFHSSMAGYLVVNGVQFEVQAGENVISVTRAQLSNSGNDYNTITIQFGAKVDGVSQMLTGEFVISDITITKTETQA